PRRGSQVSDGIFLPAHESRAPSSLPTLDRRLGRHHVHEARGVLPQQLMAQHVPELGFPEGAQIFVEIPQASIEGDCLDAASSARTVNAFAAVMPAASASTAT